MTYAFEDPRRVLARHGLAPKRAFSQNFLISERAVRTIAQACQRARSPTVVEFGAGCGTLTQALAAVLPRVYAIERDPDMLRVLQAECDPARVHIVPADAKQLDLRAFAGEPPTRIGLAGNLPYAITGAIFRNLIDQWELIEQAVLMVQREVRDRLVAAAGSAQYGALTVFTHQVFDVESVLHVPRTAFYPPPKVASSVVRLTPRVNPRGQTDPTFARVVHAAFQARRKTLRNALAQAFGPQRTDAALERAQVDGRRRGETLEIEEFEALASTLRTDVEPG